MIVCIKGEQFLPGESETVIHEPDRPHVLTSSQVAKVLGVNRKTLYRWMAEGKIPEPLRDPANNYRQWSSQEVQELQEGMHIHPEEACRR